MYDKFLDRLIAGARIKRAKQVAAALRVLSEEPRPDVVLVVDGGIIKAKPAVAKLKKLVNVHGGTVIFGCNFSSFVAPPKMDWLWSEWGVPWKMGSYHRTTVQLNQRAAGRLPSRLFLKAAHSQKAVFLNNVEASAAVYFPSTGSKVESMVFAPEPVDVAETPVAWNKMGEGWLGYVGDVNIEDGSIEVMLTMCGV